MPIPKFPKVIGFQRIAELSDDSSDQALSSAAKFFWQTVTQHRSVAIGGNSTQEHFNPADNFTSMIVNREGPESCNSYNMLKLTQALFDADPQATYFDFAKRVLYNHILTTIDDHGFVYFTPCDPAITGLIPPPTSLFGAASEQEWKTMENMEASSTPGKKRPSILTSSSLRS